MSTPVTQASPKIKPSDLDAFFNAGYNLILRGKPGVGKTAQIKACFERNGLVRNETYLYFSCSTLDPWVDFVGVPTKNVDEKGEVFLDLIRPKLLTSGKIKAIIFDEFNRSPKKIRNAVMELMQFRSINGKELPGLQTVWAAINPDEDDLYDVEKIDPAQIDRFHTMVIDVPYEVCKEYFVEKYGQDNAIAAIEWWDMLPEDVKNQVTPRRLEYAMDAIELGLPLEFILPVASNIKKLTQSIKIGPIANKLEGFIKKGDSSGAKMFLANHNNFTGAKKYIVEDEKYMEFFLPVVPNEQVIALLAENKKVQTYICENAVFNNTFAELLGEVMRVGENKELRDSIRGIWQESTRKTSSLNPVKPIGKLDPVEPYFNAKSVDPDFKELDMLDYSNPAERQASFNKVKKLIPEKMNKDQAFKVLRVLHLIVKDTFNIHLMSPDYDKLSGIINHCVITLKNLNVIAVTEKEDLIECLVRLYPDYTPMFNKLKHTKILNEIVRS